MTVLEKNNLTLKESKVERKSVGSSRTYSALILLLNDGKKDYEFSINLNSIFSIARITRFLNNITGRIYEKYDPQITQFQKELQALLIKGD